MRGRKNRQRLSISVDVPSGTDHLKINCDLRNASGMAWFDGFQLEEGACANDLNILQNADFSASGRWYTEEDNAANIQNGSVSCGGADYFSTLYTYANRSNSNATTNYVKTFTQKYGETQLLKYYYTFDERGNISHVSESDNQSNSFESFEYDFLNQLYIVVDKRNQTYMHFSYDDGGNITQVVKSNYDAGSNQPSTQIYCNTYTYDNVWKDKLVSFNNQAITYDAMGNPLQYRDGLSFTWKNGRQLAAVTQNNETLAMTYDCNGLRTQKGGTHYYYDSDNNLIAMYDGTHTLFFYYDENGNATSFSLGGNMYFYVKNLQGDIINIVDSNGAVLVRYDYDVLGKIVNITDDSDPLITGVQNFALINPLRYRGYVYDDETGLYYLQSRYYDPVTGRFLNADIYVDTGSGSPLSTNMFAYCENRFLICTDTNGCTSFNWSWRRTRDTYHATLILHYWNWSPVFKFTVSANGIVSFPFASEKKINKKYTYYVNSNYWNYRWLLSIGDTYALAYAIRAVAKSINWMNLTWRSVNGIKIELAAHYFAFFFGYKMRSSYNVQIGSSCLLARGYDSNAYYFEIASFADYLFFGSSYLRYIAVKSMLSWI